MNTPILNRAFQHPQDDWYHIEPIGEHPNSAGGVVQVIDADAVNTIVNRFNTAADAGQLSHGAEMLIDHEHFSHDAEKETRAFGWLNRLQARADGIYGQVRWTTTGRAAVDGGDYRFFSTEYDPAACALVNRADPKRLRPLALSGLTLTNRPNNRGGKPITNRETLSPVEPAAAAGALAVKRHNEIMKLINTKLGLSAEAAESATIEALDQLFNRATTAEGELAPLKIKLPLLENRINELLGEQIEADLATHGITDEAKIAKLKPVLVTMKNRAERVDFLGMIGKGDGAAPAAKPLTNRESARTPGAAADGGDANKALEGKKAALIANRARAIKTAQPGHSLQSTFLQAQREIETEIETGVLVVK